ncbi:MAG: FtsW/RodA/SpoVE family cell cycle protein [Acidimicrobiales bacterium]
MGRVRRTTELGLLLLGALIVIGAYSLTALGRTASLPANIGPFLGMLLALFAIGHLAVRKLAPQADGLLLPLAGLLNGLGYVFIARMDTELAAAQATWSAVGMAGFVATLVLIRRARNLEHYRYSFAALGILLLLLPSVPVIGQEINGARIWIRVGPMSFQPGEAAKLALAAFIAGYLVEKRELLALSTKRLGPLYLPDPRHLGPLLAAWGVSLLVMVNQKDLGSSLLFFTLFIVLVWVATGRAAYLLLGVGLFAGGATIAYQLFGHVRDRVTIWLDPWPVAKEAGYQIVEAAFAMADGGLTGTGLGLGDPSRIPANTTDFIFAVVAEELGLVGATALLMAYLLLVGSGLRIALQADSNFDKLLATGLTTLLGVQAFVIIGGVTRVLPLTGVTLPFMSFGGSSLLANYVLLALLVRISDEATARSTARAAEVAVGESPTMVVGS